MPSRIAWSLSGYTRNAPDKWLICVPLARELLTTMKPPTEEMIAAAMKRSGLDRARIVEIWESMLDEARKEIPIEADASKQEFFDNRPIVTP